MFLGTFFIIFAILQFQLKQGKKLVFLNHFYALKYFYTLEMP